MKAPKINLNKTIGALAALAFLTTSCTSDSSDEKQVELPSTYSFENVDFSGQLQRVAMLDELVGLAKSANTKGTVLKSEDLKNRFYHTNSPYSNPELNTSTKQLANKTYEHDLAYFDNMLDSLAALSESTEVGQAGVGGLVSSANGQKFYLQNAQGKEYTQLLAKGLMGAVLYYQAVSSYLNDEDGIAESVDNITIEEGKGTALSHHWDEAYGYFAGSTDYPADGTGKFWGAYAEELDEHLGSNSSILAAFIKGRVAIKNNDRPAMLAAAEEVKSEWDRLIAGCAVHYINKSLSNLGDDASRNHSLSEGYAFAGALKYNADMKISSSNLNKVLEGFGDDFYNVSPAKLKEAKALLVEAYQFGEIADLL